MQTNVQIDSKNLRSNDDNFRSRSHHITIEVSAINNRLVPLVAATISMPLPTNMRPMVATIATTQMQQLTITNFS